MYLAVVDSPVQSGQLSSACPKRILQVESINSVRSEKKTIPLMYIPCELDYFTQQPESVVMERSKRKRSDNEGSTTAKKFHPSSTPILEVVYLMHMYICLIWLL